MRKIKKVGNRLKKFLLVALLSVMTLFLGCSPIEEASNTVTYVKEATQYAVVVTDFYQTVPDLISQTTSDSQAKQELDRKLKDMQEAIQSFNQLENPPEQFAEYHDIIVGHNEQLLAVIDAYMKSGMENLELLNDADLINSMKDITKAIEDIKNITQ